MATKGPTSIQTANNGLVRCYNLFPSYFSNIEEMTQYLDTLHAMGINTVWLNPIQLAGFTPMPKADISTGVSQRVSRSIYAMHSPHFIDPRFSMVKRDSDNDMMLTSNQIKFLLDEQNAAALQMAFAPVAPSFKITGSAFDTLIAHTKKQRFVIRETKNTVELFPSLQSDLNNAIRLSTKVDSKASMDKGRGKAEKTSFFIRLQAIDRQLPSLKTLLNDNKISDPIESLELETVLKQQPTLGPLLKKKLEENKQAYETSQKEQEATLQQFIKAQNDCVHLIDKHALQQFTARAKFLGITPIFDLVLNHVAKDAPVAKDPATKDWFGDDSTYIDAVAFKYSELLQFVHLEDSEVDALIQKDPILLQPLREKIVKGELTSDDKRIIQSSDKLLSIEKEQLMLKVMFNFVRLNDKMCDDILKDPVFSSDLKNRAKAKSLTEADKLFITQSNKLTPEEQAKIFAKGYYKLSHQQRSEIYLQIPKIMDAFWSKFIDMYMDYGFSGARVDCVRKVPQEVRKMAYERIQQKVEARDGKNAPVVILEEALFSDLSSKQFAEVVKGADATHITGSIFNNERLWHGGLSYDHNNEDFHKKGMVKTGVINFTGNHDHYSCAMTVCREIAMERLQKNVELFKEYQSFVPNSEAQKDIRKTIFIHHYVQEIIRELQDSNLYWDQIVTFGKKYRDKLLTNMFSGSGGYYILAGDESASLAQPTVFLRDNGEPLYPTEHLKILSDPRHPHYDIAQQALTQVAINWSDNSDLSKPLRETSFRLLTNVIAKEILTELRAKDKYTEEEFFSEYRKQYAVALLDMPQSAPLKQASHAALQALATELLAQQAKRKQSAPSVEIPPEEMEKVRAEKVQELAALIAEGKEQIITAYANKLDAAIKTHFQNFDSLNRVNDPNDEIAQKTLTEVAAARAKHNHLKKSEGNLEIYLSAFKQQICNELDGKVEKTESEFFAAFRKQYALALLDRQEDTLFKRASIEIINTLAAEDLKPKRKQKGAAVAEVTPQAHALKVREITQLIREGKDKELSNAYITEMNAVLKSDFKADGARETKALTADNGWGRPATLARFANVEFMKEINDLIAKLPVPQTGYWSEIFKLQEDVLVIARKNGTGFTSESDLVIINLDPDSPFPYTITKDDIHKMATWLQERKFGRDAYDTMKDDPEFKKAYGAFMGSTEFRQKPAKLFFAGSLTVDESIKDYSIKVNGIDEKFEIVVAPKAERIKQMENPEPGKIVLEYDILDTVKSYTPMASSIAKQSLQQASNDETAVDIVADGLSKIRLRPGNVIA